MNEDVYLKFLANLINEREAKKSGFSMAVRWLCLREDLRQKYLLEAESIVASWWNDEQQAERSRHENDSLIISP